MNYNYYNDSSNHSSNSELATPVTPPTTATTTLASSAEPTAAFPQTYDKRNNSTVATTVTSPTSVTTLTPSVTASSFPTCDYGVAGSNNSGSHSNDDDDYDLQEDLLTVFQAAPLAYVDGEGNEHPMKTLDFEFERQLLQKTIEEAAGGGVGGGEGTDTRTSTSSSVAAAAAAAASSSSSLPTAHKKIHVNFEIAVTDRLSAFLAQNQGQILHFSCHAHQHYLALEDGWGKLQPLGVNELRQWIRLGGQNLYFVFVSACYSSFIGQAFVDAGVQHVVCCKHNSQVREVAAVEFEKTFYRNLAFGNPLQQAFDIARQEILVSPHLSREHRREDYEKFCLLPLHTNHDVPIFFQRRKHSSRNSIQTTTRRKVYHPPNHFPPPPDVLMGRELDLYHILQSLKDSRLVRITGPKGVGKSALMKSCCQYLNDRMHIVDFTEILWIPTHNNLSASNHSRSTSGGSSSSGGDTLLDTFQHIYDMILEEEYVSPYYGGFLTKAAGEIGKIVDHLHHRKPILIIDARDIIEEHSLSKLTIFVEKIINGTKRTKLIIIHQIGYQITPSRTSGVERDIYVDALDFPSSLALFGRLCPHRQTTCRLFETLQNQNQRLSLSSSSSPCPWMPKRIRDIYEMIGNGNPLDTHSVARSMTPTEYERLLSLVKQPEDSHQFESRAALLQKQKELNQQIAQAVADKDFDLAQQLQIIYDDLETQKDDLPDVHELKQKFEETTYEIQMAATSKDFRRAKQLQAELNRYERAIRIEMDTEQDEFQNVDSDLLQTRASLEARIAQLEVDYKKACDSNDFTKAREIDEEQKRLIDARQVKPSRQSLEIKVSQLHTDLEKAKLERNIDVAEMIYKHLVRMEIKMKLEERAETTLGIKVCDINSVSNEPTSSSSTSDNEPNVSNQSNSNSTGNGRRQQDTTTATTKTDLPEKRRPHHRMDPPATKHDPATATATGSKTVGQNISSQDNNGTSSKTTAMTTATTTRQQRSTDTTENTTTNLNGRNENENGGGVAPGAIRVSSNGANQSLQKAESTNERRPSSSAKEYEIRNSTTSSARNSSRIANRNDASLPPWMSGVFQPLGPAEDLEDHESTGSTGPEVAPDARTRWRQRRHGGYRITENESDGSVERTLPGAVRITPRSDRDNELDNLMSIDSTSQPDRQEYTPMEHSLQQDDDDQLLIAAEVVPDHDNLEQIIMDTVLRNTVQAVEVVPDPDEDDNKKPSILGRLFRGRKKKDK